MLSLRTYVIRLLVIIDNLLYDAGYVNNFIPNLAYDDDEPLIINAQPLFICIKK